MGGGGKGKRVEFPQQPNMCVVWMDIEEGGGQTSKGLFG